jgi:hypothetical protein
VSSEVHVDGRLDRIEAKLDRVEDALVLLARIDERLVSHTDRVEWLGRKMEALEKRVSALELSRAKLLGAVAVLGGLSSFAGSFIKSLLE